MKPSRRLFLHLAAASAVLIGLPAVSWAQSDPSRPITLIVPFPPGGGNDIMARLVGERMSKTLGQQIVVENRPGAGGTVVHVATEMMANAAGIDIKSIPYKGTAPAISDLIGGHVTLMIPPIPAVIGHVKAGTLRAIGVTSQQRSPLLPEVPTLSEAGLTGFFSEQRYGLMAPAGTPKPIVERLNKELRAALAVERVRQRIIDDGAVARPDSPEEYGVAIATDQKTWGGIVKKLGLRVE